MQTLPGLPFAVGNTLMGFTVAEFQIIVGVTQMGIEKAAPNGFEMSLEPNWQSVLVMSPPTALHLLRQLTDCVKGYEAKFGAIQSDPAVQPPAAREGTVVSLWGAGSPLQPGAAISQADPGQPEPSPPAA